MYCQIDKLEEFSNFQIQITEKRVEELFLVCLKNDSMKIAFHLNKKFGITYNQSVISALNNSIKDSEWYFEMKMFFVRQSFPHYNVQQMDELLQLFTSIFEVVNVKRHPLVNCYNPVKCSLLVYEICHRIQKKNIYSLQRNCDYLMKYLKTSLDKYFNSQGNINHLYKLMKEPILSINTQQDSMDLIYLMDMKDLIQHKVVEEVLNLVYDGKYSIDTTPLYLSSLWNTMTQMSTFSQKSVFKRLIANINTMGAWRMKKQSSIQFNIWKQCIRQREIDEMTFMCIVSVALISITSLIDSEINTQFEHQLRLFGANIYGNTSVLNNASVDVMKEYCALDISLSGNIYNWISIFISIKMFLGVSYIASISAYILTVISKPNVVFDVY